MASRSGAVTGCVVSRLLLLTILSLHSNCLKESLLPLAFACNLTEQLHILVPAGDATTSSNDEIFKLAGLRVCLNFYSSYDNNWQTIVLTNATQLNLISSNGQQLLHLAFKIPSEYMECQYYYRWKIEQLPQLNGSFGTTGHCAASTQEQKCEIDIGRYRGCTGWRPSESNGLSCRPELIEPDNYNTLHRLLCDQRELRYNRMGVPAWLAPVTASAVCVLLAIGAVLAIYRLLSKRAMESRGQLITASSAATTSSSQTESIMSVFSLLSNRQRLRQVLESRIWSSSQLQWSVAQMHQQCHADCLLVNPDDTARRLCVEEVCSSFIPVPGNAS